MISILIPTRGRFDNLNRCLNSFLDNSKNHLNFEILLGMDSDDLDSVEMVKNYINTKKVSNIKIIITDRMYYKNFHKYMENLLHKSSGKFIWLLADDVEVTTLNWDDILIEKCSDKNFLYGYIKILNYENWPFSLVPLINKKWVEITGRISENSQTDLWLGHIAHDLSVITKINEVEVTIFKDSTGSQHNSDKFYTEDKIEWTKDKNKIDEYIKNI